eukprot:scaffold9442_cov117-Isochrysis_galbana.AAC.7
MPSALPPPRQAHRNQSTIAAATTTTTALRAVRRRTIYHSMVCTSHDCADLRLCGSIPPSWPLWPEGGGGSRAGCIGAGKAGQAAGGGDACLVKPQEGQPNRRAARGNPPIHPPPGPGACPGAAALLAWSAPTLLTHTHTHPGAVLPAWSAPTLLTPPPRSRAPRPRALAWRRGTPPSAPQMPAASLHPTSAAPRGDPEQGPHASPPAARAPRPSPQLDARRGPACGGASQPPPPSAAAATPARATGIQSAEDPPRPRPAPPTTADATPPPSRRWMAPPTARRRNA